jgi:hypothetical protein
VQNVLAQGSAALETRGHLVHVGQPRLRHDPAGRGMALPVRLVLRLLRVPDYLELTRVAESD